jgi:hypothetical protein
MKKTCFVIQGFGVKTDYETGRKLDLDASYEVIKEAVEAAGLTCIRADEVQHAGVIDLPMYQAILESDLVIADLSTSNANAFYELGVRHALRPYTTIIIAEQQFTKAFDISRNLIRTYKHLGEDIGRNEANRFSKELQAAITEIMANPCTDSPLYTCLPDLQRPRREPSRIEAVDPEDGQVIIETYVAQPAAAEAEPEGIASYFKKFRTAKAASDWDGMIGYLQELRKLKPDDAYITQQLALATYKSKPGDKEALQQAQEIIRELNPIESHDAETLGLWGAVHKRLWEIGPEDDGYLNDAILAYRRGFYLGQDFYNGINYAFLLNARAVNQDPALAIADWIEAERVRRDVIQICTDRLISLESEDTDRDQWYWVLATLWEAAVGIGDAPMAYKWEQQARACARENWMLKESTEPQIQKLKDLLMKSPLDYLENKLTGG